MADQKKHFLSDIEEQVLDRWEAEKTFEKSLEQRQGNEVFNFYDGPPFANGLPHYGHVEQTTIKDTVTRYKTMRGYYVPRTVGWDTHGLPVEYAIEKEHGFRGKQDIIAYGIDNFNNDCRDSVFMYQDVWEKMYRRVGRWADYSKSYATMDPSYIESVWWVFNTIYDKGLIYKDFRCGPYCPRCATPLSNFELNQGYQDNVPDPSLYVKFKLLDQDAYLLGWTTTPWSLPGNAAVAVKPDAQYVYVELTDDDDKKETVVVARDRIAALSSDNYHITREVLGKDLVGLSYEPLFKLDNIEQYEHSDNLYKVWPAEFVSIEEGSGVLHVAPAFGEDDLSLGKKHSLPVLLSLDDNGKIRGGMGLPDELTGVFFKTADKHIIALLSEQNAVYAAETFTHTYPFCWRCDTPLLYYATDSWMVRVTEVKDNLVQNNNVVNWTPGHIKDKRFGNWLQGARDWAISRNRFWGAPLPVWVTDDGEVTVIGSIAELKEKAVDPSKVNDLHRPYIDDIEIRTDSGKIAHRIEEVFDCWFESGSMPYAQDHYPFEDKDEWEKHFPATFIAEAIDQTRGWFYTLHVLGTALFNKPAFENVICSGLIVAADGQKLSKRKKNYPPIDEVFEQFGVDTLRFFIASSPLVNGEDTRFSADFLRDVQRGIFMTLNNIYSFYKLYADVDGWKPAKPLEEPQSINILDQWMIARLNQTIHDVTKNLDLYRLDRAARPIAELLDDTSNWYVRRSRRRFWKSEDDSDKQQAYVTLHYTLLRLCQLLAPSSPFLSDHLWNKLVQGTNLPDSVHLSDWPEVAKPDAKVLATMEWVRDAINDGLGQRAAAGIKVRQPLNSVHITVAEGDDLSSYAGIIAEELNVKEVVFENSADRETKVILNAEITPELKREGLMREVVRNIQQARKQAQLEVDDRIDLVLNSFDDELATLFKKYTDLTDTIMQETLAVSLNELQLNDFTTTVKIEGKELTISLAKAVKN